MKIYKLGNRYIADSEYSEKDILKMASFRWDPESGHWWTDDLDKIRFISDRSEVCIDKEVLKELEGRFGKENNNT
jgi:hypothetical protein